MNLFGKKPQPVTQPTQTQGTPPLPTPPQSGVLAKPGPAVPPQVAKNAHGAKPVLGFPSIQHLEKGMISLPDLLAPSSVEVDFRYIRVGDKYYRTFFVVGYPR